MLCISWTIFFFWLVLPWLLCWCPTLPNLHCCNCIHQIEMHQKRMIAHVENVVMHGRTVCYVFATFQTALINRTLISININNHWLITIIEWCYAFACLSFSIWSCRCFAFLFVRCMEYVVFSFRNFDVKDDGIIVLGEKMVLGLMYTNTHTYS